MMKKFFNFSILQSFNNRRDARSGQSLVEVIVGLAIGAILMGASALAIAGMLQANLTTQKWRAATGLAQGLLNNARAYGTVNWQNVYGLSKGSGTPYFLNASGTTYNVVQGIEGSLDNDVTNGLVGEWKFDEDAGTTSTRTYDASGNGNNGTLTNSPTRATSTCKIGNCLVFNGSSTYVSTPITNLSGSAITVAYWFKGSYLQSAVRQQGASYLVSGWNGYHILSNDGGTGSGVSVGTAATDGNWHHVAMTWQQNTANGFSSYLDGKLVAQRTSSNTAIPNVAQNVLLGSYAGSAEFLNGTLDDVRIYNRALSADEVWQLYNSNVFTRYFYVENSCRTNDASSSVTGVAPCGGISTDDPSTQKITSIAQWNTVLGSQQQSIIADYITRWQNTVFQQKDWSGGQNASTTVTGPTNVYSSSTGINVGKSLRIQGL